MWRTRIERPSSVWDMTSAIVRSASRTRSPSCRSYKSMRHLDLRPGTGRLPSPNTHHTPGGQVTWAAELRIWYCRCETSGGWKWRTKLSSLKFSQSYWRMAGTRLIRGPGALLSIDYWTTEDLCRMAMRSRNGREPARAFVYEPMPSLRSGTRCPQENERRTTDACGCLLHSTVERRGTLVCQSAMMAGVANV